jgi:hypothetical protein
MSLRKLANAIADDNFGLVKVDPYTHETIAEEYSNSDLIKLRNMARRLRRMQGRSDSPYSGNRAPRVDFRGRADLMRRLREGNLLDQGLDFSPYEDMHIQSIGLYPMRDPAIYGG